MSQKRSYMNQGVPGGYGRFPYTTSSWSDLTLALPAKSSPQLQNLGRKITLWLGIGILTLLTLLLVWHTRITFQNGLAFLHNQEQISAKIQSYGAWGPLVLAAAQLLQVLVAFIPGHMFLVVAGYIYGFTRGFLLNLVCIVSASQIAFLLARRAGRPLVSRLVSPELLDRWYEIGEKQGFVFFTIAFLLPVFPTDIMNFVAGLSGISSRRFLAANFLGRLPGAVMLTLIGSHGVDFSRGTWVIIGAITAVAFLLGRITVTNIERRYRNGRSSKSALSKSSSLV
ncbi:MAG: TVP38/TMEM64 family protein [Chloroflexi bacterium]|nr:MAG: TVP38/TMEM64 family protein [Chloroflexota bacterium]